jgi:hypothetical protein
MRAKLVAESLEQMFEEKKDTPKMVGTEQTKAKLEKSKPVKVTGDVKEKIAALKKVQKELEGKLQQHAGPLAKSKVKAELTAIKAKIAAWNKKL